MLSYRLYTLGTQTGWQLAKNLPWLISWLVPGDSFDSYHKGMGVYPSGMIYLPFWAFKAF